MGVWQLRFGPAPITRAHSTGVITSVVEAMTPAVRECLQGFVDAAAVAVAQELSRYDDHGEYAIDHLPAELTTLESANDWSWPAQLYLVEQYHDMIQRGDVEFEGGYTLITPPQDAYEAWEYWHTDGGSVYARVGGGEPAIFGPRDQADVPDV